MYFEIDWEINMISQVFNKQLFYLNTAIETQEIYITRGLDTSKEE